MATLADLVRPGTVRRAEPQRIDLPLDPLDVILLAQELRVCLGTPDGQPCGASLVVSNDDTRELVCSKCGRVWGTEPSEETIPFDSGDVASGHSEGHFNPDSESSDGHGLGSNTQARKQGHSASRLSYAVVSKFVDKPTVITCPHCGKKTEMNDLPLRAQHLTTITEQYEHPKMKTVLRWGRMLMKDLGYDQATDLTFVFKKQVGLIERTVTQKLIDRNVRVNLREVAKACVFLGVREIFGVERSKNTYRKLKPDVAVLKDVVKLWKPNGKKEGGEA